MNYFKSIVCNFIQQEDGPTAVEYAVMLATIVLVCVASIVLLGQSARDTFDFIANSF